MRKTIPIDVNIGGQFTCDLYLVVTKWLTKYS